MILRLHPDEVLAMDEATVATLLDVLREAQA